MYKMPPELVSRYFAHDVTIFRRRADGTCKRIRTVNGGRLVSIFDHERLDGAAIAWCLNYGNWPIFPLAILDGNPHNLSLDNIYPVRLAGVRYRERVESGRFYHPLSNLPHRSAKECFADWVIAAREHYMKDMSYVLHLEAEQRKLRKAVLGVATGVEDWERRQAARKTARAAQLAKVTNNPKRPPKPAKVPGRVWHYYNKSWLSVPESVHVSDDCRRRCDAVLRGAVRAEYQPEYDETWYFDAAGEVVKPA